MIAEAAPNARRFASPYPPEMTIFAGASVSESALNSSAAMTAHCGSV